METCEIMRPSQTWLRWGHRLLDALYPAECACCAVPVHGPDALCRECDRSLPRIEAPCCATCGECHDGRIDGEFECPNCTHVRFAFDFTRPVLRRDPRSLELVHRLKYAREIHLAHSLGRILAEALGDERFERAREERWPLVPVPLHRSRVRVRYFNQSHELAREASRGTGLPLVPALRRVRRTGTQTALGRSARQQNLKGAFTAVRPWEQQSTAAGAILVDDVFTTGSTLHACALALKQAGCSDVCAITLLRG